MKTSAAGRAAIVAREGKRLTAYRDSVGVLTIGVGHTGRMSPPKVTAGMRITDAQCDAFLAADLAPVEDALNAVLKVPVTQNQFDALISFLFNVGVGWAGVNRHAVASIFTRLNAGNLKGAAAAFDFFHKPPEIVGRRNQEKAQFLRADSTTSAVVAEHAAILQKKADTTRAAAKADAKLGAGAAIVAAGIAATQPAVAHHHAVLWIGALAFAAVAIAGVVIAVLSHRKAETLATTAEALKRDAATFGTTDALQP